MDTIALRHPFTCIVAGPSGAGKTTFVLDLIRNADHMIQPNVRKIIWCYSEWQSLYAKFPEGVEFHEGLPTSETLSPPETPKLVILDDLQDNLDKSIAQLFTKKSHHHSCSVVYVTQNFFEKGKYNRTVNINAHYIAFFKNPRDGSTIQFLARQMFYKNANYLVESYHDATREGHGYIFIDARQETPDHLRLRTNIFSTREHYVYIPKKK